MPDWYHKEIGLSKVRLALTDTLDNGTPIGRCLLYTSTGVGCDVIAQLIVGFHATFEVFHHRQRVVILGFQFADAPVQGILVGQALFLQKFHGLCHNFEIVFREPTLIADALVLGLSLIHILHIVIVCGFWQGASYSGVHPVFIYIGV